MKRVSKLITWRCNSKQNDKHLLLVVAASSKGKQRMKCHCWRNTIFWENNRLEQTGKEKNASPCFRFPHYAHDRNQSVFLSTKQNITSCITLLGGYRIKMRVDLVRSHVSSRGAEWNLNYPVTDQKNLTVLEGFKSEGHWSRFCSGQT